MLREGAAQVDATISRLVGAQVDEAALSFLQTAPTFGQGQYFTEDDADRYADFNAGLDQLGHGQNFATLFNALVASGADADALRYLYGRQINDFGSSQVGSSGRWVTGGVGGSALLGILPALGVEAAAACASNPAICTNMLNTLGELFMGDALGGHTLGTVATGTVGAAAVGDEVVEQVARRVDDEIAALERMGANSSGAALIEKAPNSVLNEYYVRQLDEGNLPGTAIGGLGTPREMPVSPNPSASAEDFALRVLGRSPTAEELAVGASMNHGNCLGCWRASPDGGNTFIVYRSAGGAGADTLRTTSTVEINYRSAMNPLNAGKPLKLKFPLSGGGP